MSTPVVTFAMCSIVAIFVAMYVFVGYLTDGTELSSPGVPTQSVAASNRERTSTPDPKPVTITPMSNAVGTPLVGFSQPRIAPPASATFLAATASLEPTVTATNEAAQTAQPTSTAAINYEPTASPTADLAMLLVQLVVSAEEKVQTGHLEATVESEGANDSSSSITFDLGGATRSARMHFVSSYRSEAGQRVTELIMIGDTSWERIDGGEWVKVGAREGVWGQVRSFLPGVAAFAETGQVRVEGDRLTWSDSVRDIDVILQVDAATGVPQQLRRASRSTNSVVTVTYSGWNAPVDIQAPSSPRPDGTFPLSRVSPTIREPFEGETR